MSIFLYPEFAYFNIVNTSSTELGSYTVPEAGDISLAHLRILNRNANQFSYQMRLVLSRRVKGPIFAASNWETFSSDAIGQTSTFWMGDLTFTFEDYHLTANDTFLIRLETIDYSRSGNSIYMGAWLDWGFGAPEVVAIGTENSAGTRIALGVKR